ncbi:MAG: type IV toxin-antitoxin system AbiEi family antitoxin domain-containing protein, partial [Jatrophihabitans endophyticus]|nr:type IV toxin-antitoxin system AbiEi family antitoxin domain-containing protein [Jatrophihabitans endophyticus]
MRSLPPDPVFTLEHAAAAGWTSSALRHAVRCGRVARVRRGVYTGCGQITPAVLDRAAALTFPSIPLSHTSGARVWEVPLVGVRHHRTEMTVAPVGNADLAGVYSYRARVRDHELAVRDGMLVTSPARTVLDLARHHPTLTAVVALDHVLHNGLATADELRDVLDFCRSWPGAARARKAVALCDSRSESPLESLSRLVFPRLGLPAPEPQVLIFDAHGVFVARSDFYWDHVGVVGEADGESKYDDGRAILVA